MTMRVSVIIPIFNVEPYIEACLQSVANQTMTDGVECILVDDCGTDESMQLVEQFVKNYQGDITFSILHHDHNRGLSAARNTGIRAAQGEYIYFLDSDDEIVPDCLETLWGSVKEHPGIDLIQGSYITADSPYLNQFLHPSFPEYTDNRKLIKRSLLNYDVIPIMAQNRLVRREMVLSNDIFFKEGIIHEDNHWAFFLAKYVRTMAYCRHMTYVYNVTPGSITNNRNVEKEIHCYQTIIRDFCANVDPYLRKAQCYCIFLLLDIVLRSKYYHSIEEKDELYHLLYMLCNPMEKLCLKGWYHAPVGSWKHRQYGRVLQHLFKLY